MCSGTKSSRSDARPRLRDRRGSVLTVALVLGAAMALGLTSFLGLSALSMFNSNRTLHLNYAVNLAEAGIEEALFALNRHRAGDGAAWDGWTIGDFDADGTADDARRVFPTGYFRTAQQRDGQFSVVVLNRLTGMPTIATKGTVALPRGGAVSKYLRAEARRRSYFANALVATGGITFSGNNPQVDSYRSDLGDYSAAPSLINRFDNATVASSSVSVAAVEVQNADIWGVVATGGSPPQVGKNGTIAELGNPQGTVDQSRISLDFHAQLDPVAAPSTVGALALPAKVGGVYVLGTPGATTPTVYSTGSISLTGAESIQVVGPVVLVVTGDLKNAGNVSSGVVIEHMPQLYSSGRLIDGERPPLKLYISGDIDITGNGFVNKDSTGANEGVPGALQIYGTAASSQSFKIAGNGDLRGVVYAPRAAVTVGGNGDTYGSIIAHTIDIGGKGAFHYDETLDDLGTSRFGVSLWTEMTRPAEHSLYAFGL